MHDECCKSGQIQWEAASTSEERTADEEAEDVAPAGLGGVMLIPEERLRWVAANGTERIATTVHIATDVTRRLWNATWLQWIRKVPCIQSGNWDV